MRKPSATAGSRGGSPNEQKLRLTLMLHGTQDLRQLVGPIEVRRDVVRDDGAGGFIPVPRPPGAPVEDFLLAQPFIIFVVP